MESCIVRLATSEDGERIGYVHYQSWIETYTGIIPQDFLAARSADKSAVIFRENKCINTVVAEIDGEVVGFCGFGEFRDFDKYNNCGEIYGIYLLNEFKRKHIGQNMMEYALEQLKILGYKEIGLWVLEANKSAICFYEKQGFTYSGISKEVNLGKLITEQLYTIKL